MDKNNTVTCKKRTAILLGIAAILLVVVAAVTAGLIGANVSRAEKVEPVTPVVQLQTRTDADELRGKELSTVELVEAVADTVVEITTSERTTDMFMQQVVQTGAGSGVIIDETGYIITNEHVISGADTITVRLNDGTEYAATLVAADEVDDIAVIKITPAGTLKSAVFGNSDLLKVGQSVVAIGNPLGSLGGTVTEGIISAKNRSITIGDTTMTLLQTSAAINPGNSGGGLFNSSGELIGVVNAKSSGSGIEGLGFAIPSNRARDVAKDLIEKGYVEGRPDTGLTLVAITDRMTAIRNGVEYLGIYVQSVNPDYTGELTVRDHIYAVDGTNVSTLAAFNKIVQAHAVGDTLEIQYHRGEESKTTTLTLVQYKP